MQGCRGSDLKRGWWLLLGQGKMRKCVQAKAILNSCLLRKQRYFAPARRKLDFTATVCCCYLTEQDNVFCCNRNAGVNKLFANW